ncbi:hypothetical protein, partial [Nostoc sp. 'Peltigera malacea cyanobiont' DB3992]|uniref:hypothetical protein n=1 Tax=Nostoc sp. 'Peltigera malacea cyanobiont' DB3992 TaxID=1206980 RepID=UPI00211EDD42
PQAGEGRQSVALAGWGSWVLISNQADMILHSVLNGTKKTQNAYRLSTLQLLALIRVGVWSSKGKLSGGVREQLDYWWA